MTKYIEIIGLPGSGKTTVAKSLVNILQNDGLDSTGREPLNVDFLGKIKILFGIFVLLLKNPSLFRLWNKSVVEKYRATPNALFIAKKLRLRFLVEIIAANKILSENKKILVNDEGIIGKIVVFSLLAGIEEKLITDLLNKLLPQNTLVIYLHAPNEMAINRSLSRNIYLPFFHEMDVDTRAYFCKQNIELYGKVCENLKYKTICVTNTLSKDELEREVEKILATIEI